MRSEARHDIDQTVCPTYKSTHSGLFVARYSDIMIQTTLTKVCLDAGYIAEKSNLIEFIDSF